ncbi:unnamed protein product, partial [Discosporangium mesarthrocarpum]
DKWVKAINDEYNSLMEQNTWDLVLLPPGRKLVGSRWLFRIKTNGRYKPRFVAQGLSQIPGVDYFATFAPVARMNSVRLLLSLAADYNWDLVHLDVKTAFLQSELNEEIYVRQPRGFEKHSPSGAPYACVFARSLYGLCQSPASWFSTIHQFLLDIELKFCLADPCVYVKGSGTVILVLYVDDIIISGASSDAINKVKEKLMTKFDLSYSGDVTTFIGMDIVRDRVEITLSRASQLAG